MGSTVTQETIAFFHIGKPLRSYKCHLQQRQYLLQYKARAKTPQKKFYFLNWYMLEPLFSAHTILLLPSPQCLQNHSSNFIESPLTFAKVKNIVKIFELELIYLSVMLTFIHPCQLNRHSNFYCFKVPFLFYSLTLQFFVENRKEQFSFIVRQNYCIIIKKWSILNTVHLMHIGIISSRNFNSHSIYNLWKCIM